MNRSVEEILKQMGWTTGLHLPVANDENKALQSELETLLIRKARATHLYESENERFNSIINHQKFVKGQDTENQNLLSAYRQHLDSQEHKFLLVQSEKERVEQEIRQTQKQKETTEQRISDKKSDLERGMTKIDKMKAETSWDSEALKAWEESLKQRDDSNRLLQEFSKEDRKKAKDLEVKMQNLQMEIVERNNTLAKLVADLTNHENILTRTGKVFKQQRNERTALLNQWKEAVNHLNRRDDSIQQTLQDISMTQQLLAEEEEKLEEQNNFLNIEINNNKELNMEIHELNVKATRLRNDLNSLSQLVFTLYSEASTLKRTLVSTANCLEKERIKSRNLTKDIHLKDDQIKQTKMKLVALQKKLNDVKNTSMTAAERANQLEKILQDEEVQTRVLSADIERIQGLLFRTQQTLTGLKNAYKIQELEISSCETALNLLNKQLQKLYNDLEKQKESNYCLDFKINDLEMKLSRLGGITDEEDKEMLDNRIEELKTAFEEENNVKQMLQHQIKNIEKEMRRLSNAIEGENAHLRRLQDKLQNEVLFFEGGIRQTAVVKLSSQQKQVDENVLQLRVNQLENLMKCENCNIYSLQKFKLELESAMRERQIEICTNKEILLVTRRNLNDDKGRLRRDIGAREIKIDQLQKRFCIAMVALGKDEFGQPISVTHYKIKNAQEKYMLQKEGDELDAKIQKTEKEIVAMENTLKVINSANVCYRNSLSAVEEFDEEAKEMRTLEDMVSKIASTVRERKRELIQKRSLIKELKYSLVEMEEKDLELKQRSDEIDKEINDLEQMTENQRLKINKADRHLQMCLQNVDSRVAEKYHKNLGIRLLQDANKSTLQQLAEAYARYQEMTPNINRYILSYQLQLPGSKVPSTPSSSSSSSRSSKYYASGPCISTVLLTFDTNDNKTPKKCSFHRKLF